MIEPQGHSKVFNEVRRITLVPVHMIMAERNPLKVCFNPFSSFLRRYDYSIILASYAPFLSLSNRADLFSTDENPGPGSYDLRGNPMPTMKVR